MWLDPPPEFQDDTSVHDSVSGRRGTPRARDPRHATDEGARIRGARRGARPDSRGERVLEIGAGSGRDAARLMALGVKVGAVEPSAALREPALADHPELEGRLFHDFLNKDPVVGRPDIGG